MPMKTTVLYLRQTVAMLLLTIPAIMHAQLVYTTTNGTSIITDYTGFPTTLTIPRRINCLPVTSIGSSAFSTCAKLTSVTSIGDYAFEWCMNLTKSRYLNNTPKAVLPCPRSVKSNLLSVSGTDVQMRVAPTPGSLAKAAFRIRYVFC